MDFSIKIGYPAIFIVFCLLAGLAFAFSTYYKRETGFSALRKYPTILLFSLRFFAVSLIAFFLLSPFLRSYTKKVEEPIVVVAVDNSRSILLNKDSLFYSNEFPGLVKDFTGSLEGNYKVHLYNFGEGLSSGGDLNFTGRETDYTELLKEINDRYSGQNLGAIVVATDGIYNKGMNPVFHPFGLNVPVYTLAMGDTVAPRDVFLRQVRNNNIVYLGNDFPIQITAAATKAQNERTKLTVSRAGKQLYSKDITIQGDNFSEETNVFITADAIGLQKYTVELSAINGEISYVNNKQDIFVEVLDSRRKILLVANSPHPDIAVFRKVIEKNEQYEVEVVMQDEIATKLTPGKLESYQLVILHQLPGSQNQASQLLGQIRQNKIPVVAVLGSGSTVNTFNTIDLGVQIRPTGSGINEVLPVNETSFNYFTLSDNTLQAIRRFPPLHSHYASYSFSSNHQVLLSQQIGQVKTQNPLLAFVNNNDHKVAVLAGEGIWKWYLHNYSIAENHDAVEELISKTVQYLSLRTDTRLFRVSTDKNIFLENEAVVLQAQLYNNIYEPVKGANIQLQVQDEESRIFEYTFREAINHYELNAGQLPPGNYTYVASTEVGGKTERINGQFVVKAIELEYINTVADHALLNNWSEQSGGAMFYPTQLQDLGQQLNSRDDINAFSYMQFELKELINLRLLFFLIFIFLAAEWFLRKYYGTY